MTAEPSSAEPSPAGSPAGEPLAADLVPARLGASPLEAVLVAVDAAGRVREVHALGERRRASEARAALERGRLPDGAPARLDPRPCREARRQLEAYLAGDLRRFELELAPVGTPFRLRVWEALREVPYGETTSYGALARRLGAPRAARAVGAANGANPLSLVVPCHRVVGADGRLVGYGGGLAIKGALLALERGAPELALTPRPAAAAAR